MNFITCTQLLIGSFGEIIFSPYPSVPLAYKVDNFQEKKLWENKYFYSLSSHKNKGLFKSTCCCKRCTHPTPHPHTLQPSTCYTPICQGQGSLLQAAVEPHLFLCLHYWKLSWVGASALMGGGGTGYQGLDLGKKQMEA